MKPIIIEGCDGSGKTTLIEKARHACSTYFWSLRGMGHPPTDFACINEVAYMILRASATGIPLVIDRHPYISEPIYGPALRGSSRLPENYLSSARADLAQDFDRIIWCRPPIEIILENIGKTKDIQLAGVADKAIEIYKRYEAAMIVLSKRYQINVISYDYTNPHRLDLETLLFGKHPERSI